MFLQIHTLTSYTPALLNRDDAGLAKRIPFGDAERMRVSSQCLKRHWRMSLADTLSLPQGIRSRYFFRNEVLRRVVATGVDAEKAEELTKQLVSGLIQKSKDAKDEADPLFLKQPVLFGRPEADYFVNLITECVQSGDDPGAVITKRMKEEKKNFRAMLKQAGQDDLESGVEGAMFGRFVTSDVLARTDASVHVAHAMTVHPIANEVDYFTVLDDLDDNGAAHAGDMELGAGLFYNYVVVDVPLLVSNISGCERWEWAGQTEAIADARDIIEGLARAIATVSPGAKLGATAPYARAEAVLFEAGKAQPRTLANSYLNAIKPNDDMMQRSVDALGAHLTSLDDMYGVDESRFLATTRNPDSVPVDRSGTFPDMTRAAMDQIFGAS